MNYEEEAKQKRMNRIMMGISYLVAIGIIVAGLLLAFS